MKFKNVPASPRFDRLIGNASSDPVRPILKSHNSQFSQSGAEKFSVSSIDSEIDSVGYTPSGLQKKTIKDVTRNNFEARSVIAFDEDASSLVKSYSFSNEEGKNSSKAANELTKSSSRPTAKPIVPSHFSPLRHKSYEDTADVRFVVNYK